MAFAPCSPAPCFPRKQRSSCRLCDFSAERANFVRLQPSGGRRSRAQQRIARPRHRRDRAVGQEPVEPSRALASLVRAPDARQMAGSAQPRDQHHVESQRQPGKLGPRQKERRGGARDAPALPRRDGGCGIGGGVAGLDLDDREHARRAARRCRFRRPGSASRGQRSATTRSRKCQRQRNSARLPRRRARWRRKREARRRFHHPRSGFSCVIASARS